MVMIKPYIWIEGFGSIEVISERLTSILDTVDILIYSGKVSEITEELAKECVCGYATGYFEYSSTLWNINETAKESIKSACKEEYCIIYLAKHTPKSNLVEWSDKRCENNKRRENNNKITHDFYKKTFANIKTIS